MDVTSALKILERNPVDTNSQEVVINYVLAIIKRINAVIARLGVTKPHVKNIEIGEIEGAVASYDRHKKVIIIHPKGMLEKINRYGIIGLEATIAHEIGHSMQDNLRETLKEIIKKAEEAHKLLKENLLLIKADLIHTITLLKIDMNSLAKLLEEFQPNQKLQSELIRNFELLIRYIDEYIKYIEVFRKEWLYIIPEAHERDAFKSNLRIILKKTNELTKELIGLVENISFDDKEVNEFATEIIHEKKGILSQLSELIKASYEENSILLNKEADEALFYISFEKSLLDAYADLFMLYYLVLAYGEQGKKIVLFSPYFTKIRELTAFRKFMYQQNLSYLEKELRLILNEGLSRKEIDKLISKVGFHKRKAECIKKIAEITNGKIPRDRKSLLSFPCVGEKTADITLSYGFGIPIIAIDVHVNVISRRLGIKGNNYNELQKSLHKLFPENRRLLINKLFVEFGKDICRTKKPKCRICMIRKWCKFKNKSL